MNKHNVISRENANKDVSLKVEKKQAHYGRLAKFLMEGPCEGLPVTMKLNLEDNLIKLKFCLRQHVKKED